MPPYLLSRDSPRAQHGRRRPPRGQLARSGSLFGALKNIVSAPLAWFTAYDDQENLAGKRGRNTDSILEDEGTYHEDQPSAKRKRVDSPEPPAPVPQPATRATQGYLDVPDNLLSKQVGSRQRSGAQPVHGRASSMVASFASSTWSIPPIPGAHPVRRTASPAGFPTFGQHANVQRTQSMDPPAYRALSLSRDVSMEDGQLASATRDVTMSPSRRDPFQLRARTSLTPQPTGQTFGPNVRHKERDLSEPPPLAALLSKPQFVKPPPQPTQGPSDFTTLGSLAEANVRFSRSPVRQHSGLFFGAHPGNIAESGSAPFATPINAAEKALHDLDVYKTPLLPSRLRGVQAIPDMFKQKKSHAPVLMRSDRDRERKPRLGTSEKKKKGKEKEEEVTAPKPYAGRGGMKKMLARRKREEQRELERERENAIDEDQDEVAQKETLLETARLPSPPELAPSSRPVGGREQSSLRVGRTRTSRNHIARPVSKTKNRFSAAFDDDEDEANDESREEESKKLPTLFESPKGFSFAQDKAPVLHDSSNAKEPPISTLPFSLTKSGGAPSTLAPSLAPPFAFAPPPQTPPGVPALAPATAKTVALKSPEPVPAATPAKAPPSLPPVPSISLIPPSPIPGKPAAAAGSSTSTSVPNFFANSSIFSKPGVTIAPPTPTPAPAAESKEETKAAVPPTLFGGIPSFAPPAAPKETPASTSEVSKPAVALTFPFGQSAPSPAPVAAASTPAPSSSAFSFESFGATKDTAATQPPPSLFAIAKEAAPAPASPEVKAPLPASSPFSFGTPATKAPEASTASASLPLSFGPPPSSAPTTTTAVASATTPSPATFQFGQSKPEAAKAPEAPEAKPLFGASEPAKPSLFGAPPASSPSPFGGSQPSAAVEAPKTVFTFGTPSPSTPAATIEAPKPLFPSTSTGSTGGFTFASAQSPAAPAKSLFSFGAAPSTPVSTPAESKPPFTFGPPATPAVSAPTTLFGGPSGGSHGADVSKPFAFGSSGPTRPITPPQKEQEMRMEESPTRGNTMDINGESKPSTGFAFGGPSTSTSSPFGQSSQPASSPFAFGSKTEMKPDVKPASTFASFGQNTTSSPFGFGSKPAESVQSPVSPAPFGSSAPFGQTASIPTGTSSPFAFGAPSGGTGGFGQPSTGISSQPASPSTFGQPNPFTFATPTSATAPSNPFAFSSQPASPATGNAGLPQPPGSSGGPAFTFGAPSSATQSPSSPFGAAPSLPGGGGVGFTIGSASPQQVANGPRQIKKLPNRRGGRVR